MRTSFLCLSSALCMSVLSSRRSPSILATLACKPSSERSPLLCAARSALSAAHCSVCSRRLLFSPSHLRRILESLLAVSDCRRSYAIVSSSCTPGKKITANQDGGGGEEGMYEGGAAGEHGGEAVEPPCCVHPPSLAGSRRSARKCSRNKGEGGRAPILRASRGAALHLISCLAHCPSFPAREAAGNEHCAQAQPWRHSMACVESGVSEAGSERQGVDVWMVV